MAQINPRTFADAKNLGDNVYELILTNWGNRGLAQDPNNGSIQYPPIKNLPGTAQPFLLEGAIPILGDFLLPTIPSLFGIAIAPRSDVDRCILNFASQPQIPAEQTQPLPDGVFSGTANESITIPQGFVNYGGILASEQILAYGSPLFGPQLGPIIVRAHPYGWFSDSYSALDPAGMDTFGTALNSLPASSGPGFFVTPQLRLLLYLSSKGVLPPTKRAPFHFATSLFPFYPLAGQVPPTVVPIMGRRHVTISANVGTGGPLTVNATGTFLNRSGFGSTPGNTSTDVLLGSVAIAASASGVINITNPGCAFMTVTATGGGFFTSSVDVSIDAFD